MTKTGPVASMDYSHMWLPGMCPDHLFGCQVGVAICLLGGLISRKSSSDQEGQQEENKMCEAT